MIPPSAADMRYAGQALERSAQTTREMVERSRQALTWLVASPPAKDGRLDWLARHADRLELVARWMIEASAQRCGHCGGSEWDCLARTHAALDRLMKEE